MTRAMRMVLIFSLLERLKQRDPYKYGLHLEEKIQEKEAELATLKAKLNEVQTTLASPNRPLGRIETP
jgi:hypothetical protein